MDRMIDVGIVGAGPYGLSLAAHLREAGVKYRIFGRPMKFWRDHVPHGTKLKSDGDSSDLVDARKAMPISRFYADRDEPFATTNPIPVETFTAYGDAFQARFVPDLEPCDITNIRREGELFCLTTETGETVLARRVVLAIGVSPFRAMPEAFEDLPGELVSHSVDYGSVDHLAGRRVAVIGSGASAIDVAAVAHEAGADVTIISSRRAIAFHAPPAHRRFHQKVRRPDTGIGAGWSHWFYVNGADAFRLLPRETRIRVATTALGPAPGWFMKDRIVGHVPVLNNATPTRASLSDGKVRLDLASRDGAQTSSFVADHVVAATGFRIDMHKLAILDPSVTAGLRTEQGAPILSSGFETSVRGLYVMGPAAAYSFGPVMRFVHGARFAVPRVAQTLIRRSGGATRVAAAAPVGELAAVR